MKKEILVYLTLALLPSISAFYGESFMGDLLSIFDPLSIFLLAIFTVALVLIRKSLSKFMDDKSSAILGIVLSFGITYGAYNEYPGLGDFLYAIVGENFTNVGLALFLLLIIGIFLLVFKKKLNLFAILPIIGASIIGSGFFTDVYDSKSSMIFLGFMILIFGLIIWWSVAKEKKKSP